MRFIIFGSQRVVVVVRPFDVTAPFMPLERVHILGRGEIEAQREAVNEYEMVGWYNCNMLSHDNSLVKIYMVGVSHFLIQAISCNTPSCSTGGEY